jgi:hypothetical protein
MKRMLLSLCLLLTASFAFADTAPLKTMSFCGGATGGFYDAVANQIGYTLNKTNKVKVNVVSTNGSLDSANKLKDGDCDMAILQSDAVISRPMPINITVIDGHEEMIFWLHSKKGVKDFADLTDKDNINKGVAVIEKGGTEITIRNFGRSDKALENLNVIPFDSWWDAARAVVEGTARNSGKQIPIAGMLYIGRPGTIPQEILADYKADLIVGSTSVDSLKSLKDANGQPLYTNCSVDDKASNGITVPGMFTNPSTFCLKAQVVYNNDFFAGMPDKDARELRKTVDQTVVRTFRIQQGAK